MSDDNSNSPPPGMDAAMNSPDSSDDVMILGSGDDSDGEANSDSRADEFFNDEEDEQKGHLTRADIFPYPEPYPDQADGIVEVGEVIDNDGFGVLEAACGTGKTLMALSAGLEKVRNPNSKYQRVFCITPVKQQLRAFENDLTAINENLPEDVREFSGLTMVGKADLCSWVDADQIEPRNIYAACDDLRDPVKNQISGLGESQKIGRLKDMIEQKKPATDGGSRALQTEEWMSPYQEERPPQDYCAFYAKYRLKKAMEEETLTLNGVMTPEDVMQQASDRGLCPHAALGDSIERAEVIVGNYNHVFDPITVSAWTSALIDEETLLVVDEAHMVVPKVRDLLSDSFSLSTLSKAIGEIEGDVFNNGNERAEQTMRRVFSESGIRPDDVKDLRDVMEFVRDWMGQRAVDTLDEEDRNWQNHPEDLDFTIESPLRDPQSGSSKSDWSDLPEDTDEFTEDMEFAGYGDLMETAQTIGDAIADARRQASEEVAGYNCGETYSDTIGRVLTAWYYSDHEQFFRELVLEKREGGKDNRADKLWNQWYTVRLEMKNCIPADPIANRLDEFGGGILMSATLAPLDVYKQTVGLNTLEEEFGRPIRERVYGLSFPEENRASFATDAKKFTYKHRSHPNSRSGADTRKQYVDAMAGVVKNTPGNVLICMPSYSEADWATEALRGEWSQNDHGTNRQLKREIDKPIRTDESSSNAATEELKDWFFSDGDKVLITSLRGTLTEGVDYDGDKLRACVVAGVPIRSIGGPYPKAIQTAYNNKFGKSNGFEYAFTVPAVRKSRQALGRVIRGTDDVGVRALLDSRYTKTSGFGNVRKFLPQYEQDDYVPTRNSTLGENVQKFWNEQSI